MDIRELIQNSPEPQTIPKLAAAFSRLGIRPGMTLLCHSSLSSIGWVNGGAVAVILALQLALGKSGTLVIPSQTWSLSNPALWANPPVPESWVQEIVATMPAFDPDFSPCPEMGVIAETFRKQAGIRRSPHPQHSFTARGPKARAITRKHPLDFSLGDNSPLGTLYRMDAGILLIGCGWDSCTALHLAEHRAAWPWKAEVREYAPTKTGGWTELRNWNQSSDDFAACGAAFEKSAPGAAFKGKIGQADGILCNIRALVDFATAWFSQNRAT